MVATSCHQTVSSPRLPSTILLIAFLHIRTLVPITILSKFQFVKLKKYWKTVSTMEALRELTIFKLQKDQYSIVELVLIRRIKKRGAMPWKVYSPTASGSSFCSPVTAQHHTLRCPKSLSHHSLTTTRFRHLSSPRSPLRADFSRLALHMHQMDSKPLLFMS